MAVPKTRTSSSVKKKRRANIRINVANLVECPNCSAYRMMHNVCNKCGFYNGFFVEKRFLLHRKKILDI